MRPLLLPNCPSCGRWRVLSNGEVIVARLWLEVDVETPMGVLDLLILYSPVRVLEGGVTERMAM